MKLRPLQQMEKEEWATTMAGNQNLSRNGGGQKKKNRADNGGCKIKKSGKQRMKETLDKGFKKFTELNISYSH